MDKKRVLIVGGGFVGLRTATLLAGGMLKNGEVTLVSTSKHFIFTPWLVDLLAGSIPLEQMSADLSDIAKRDGFTFIHGTVSHLDYKKKEAVIETANGQQTVLFDAAALCQGASTNFFGIPGAESYAYQLKTPDHVERLRAKLDTFDEQVSINVVGAGPTGMETVFALREYLESKGKKAKICLIQAAPRILPGFSQRLVDHAKHELAAASVSMMEGDPVVAVEQDGVRLKSGSKIAAQITIWAGGIRPNHIDTQPSLPNDPAGNISVDRTLQADESAFAAGDAAGILNPGNAAPKTAQVAMEMAPVLARNIVRYLEGRKLSTYKHHSKGVIITAGRKGLLELGWKISVSSQFLVWIRNQMYRFRFWQMTGV
ncbi:FAD-dependent oxidoreductase [Candidatus Uhrbacteria bacterium]|nr:FAD-dependent oxidoreductase [Candidatus Uhrbacteria bacterium]